MAKVDPVIAVLFMRWIASGATFAGPTARRIARVVRSAVPIRFYGRASPSALAAASGSIGLKWTPEPSSPAAM
jgi:hypothetical protein